jgi:hypothetical protein
MQAGRHELKFAAHVSAWLCAVVAQSCRQPRRSAIPRQPFTQLRAAVMTSRAQPPRSVPHVPMQPAAAGTGGVYDSTQPGTPARQVSLSDWKTVMQFSRMQEPRSPGAALVRQSSLQASLLIRAVLMQAFIWRPQADGQVCAAALPATPNAKTICKLRPTALVFLDVAAVNDNSHRCDAMHTTRLMSACSFSHGGM